MMSENWNAFRAGADEARWDLHR